MKFHIRITSWSNFIICDTLNKSRLLNNLRDFHGIWSITEYRPLTLPIILFKKIFHVPFNNFLLFDPERHNGVLRLFKCSFINLKIVPNAKAYFFE